MNQLMLVSFLFSGILLVLRGLDLAFFTDAASGLCLTGSVWLRYAVLAVAVAVAILTGRKTGLSEEGIRVHSKAAGLVSIMAAVCFALAGVTRLLFVFNGGGTIVRALLELFCWVWMSLLARNWLRKGPWHRPTRSLYPAVVGSVLFYWCVLMRFMENSSSWHRVEPTAAVWQMLSALIFLETLTRALYLPENANRKNLCPAALTAFALCLCWELPQTLVLLVGGLRLSELPELFFGFGVCAVGALGGICAVREAQKGRQQFTKKHPRHAVG